MARKKEYVYVPMEDRPEFLALVADLVNVDAGQFPDAARQCAEKYHDAVLAGHVEVLDQMERAYRALVYKLNGGTMFGCGADTDSAANVLDRHVAAKPGQVPRWGQSGQFLLEVDGLRVRVVIGGNMLGNHRNCDLHAVDLDRPFLSTTGYRSSGLTVTANIGETVDQAARRMVLDLLNNEGPTKPIAADAGARTNTNKVPGWLVDALAGVRPDGQLAMFGDQPKPLDKVEALSGAARAKRHRDKQRELKEKHDLKPVLLSEAERQMVNELRQSCAGAPELSGIATLECAKDLDSGYFSTLEVTDARLLAVWESLPTDFSRAATALGLLRLRNNQHAELAYAVEVLQRRLSAAGLDERVTDSKRQWYWNPVPFCDYRATSAPEYMERIGRTPSVADDRAALRHELESLKAENALLESERNKSHGAVRVMTERLRRAGLPTDYRQQPGE
jgi:hypothetical protein